MTVAPRYASYRDVRNTGVLAPVQLPDGATTDKEEQPQQQQQQQNLKQEAPLLQAMQPNSSSRTGHGFSEDAVPDDARLSDSSSGGRPSSSSRRQLPPWADTPANVSFVSYYMAHTDGVDRVFIDHPIYRPCPYDDRSPALVYTYRHGDDGTPRDLSACHSILCQAALAAPILLWDTSGRCSPPAKSAQHQLSYPRQMCNGRVRPIEPAASSVRQSSRGSRRYRKGDTDEDVIFVGNDWPAGVLPVWLKAYKEMAEWDLDQQQQQQQEHANRVLLSGSWEGEGWDIEKQQQQGMGQKEVEVDAGIPPQWILEQAQKDQQEELLAMHQRQQQELLVLQREQEQKTMEQQEKQWEEQLQKLLHKQEQRRHQQEEWDQQQQQEEEGPPAWVLEQQRQQQEMLAQHQQQQKEMLQLLQQQQQQQQEMLTLWEQQLRAWTAQRDSKQAQQQQQQQQSHDWQPDGSSSSGSISFSTNGTWSMDQEQKMARAAWSSGLSTAALSGGVERESNSSSSNRGSNSSSGGGNGISSSSTSGCGSSSSYSSSTSSSGSIRPGMARSSAAELLAATADYQRSVFDPQLYELLSEAAAASPEATRAVLEEAQMQLQQLLESEQLLGQAIGQLRGVLVADANKQEDQQQQSQTSVQQAKEQQQQQQVMASRAGAEPALGPGRLKGEQQQQQQQQKKQQGHQQAQQVLQVSPPAGTGAGRADAPSAPGSHARIRPGRLPLPPMSFRQWQRQLGQALMGSKVVFAIHNFGYQGVFPHVEAVSRLGVPRHLLDAFTGKDTSSHQEELIEGGDGGKEGKGGLAAAGQKLGKWAVGLWGFKGSDQGGEQQQQQQRGEGGDQKQGLGKPKVTAAEAAGVQAAERVKAAAAAVTAVAGEGQAQNAAAAAGAGEVGVKGVAEGDGMQLPATVAAARAAARVKEAAVAVGSTPQKVAAGGVTSPSPPAAAAIAGQGAQSSQGGVQDSPAAAAGDQVRWDQPEDQGAEVNWMRAGLSSSDALVTVSPGYARELLTAPDVDPHLQHTLQQQHLQGILNGLDTHVWDPRRDASLPQQCRYGPEDAARGKAAAKELLQARLGLHPISKAPLLAFVGRLEGQKGLDVLLAALPQLLGKGQVPQQQVATGLRGKQQQQQQGVGAAAAAAGGAGDAGQQGGVARGEQDDKGTTSETGFGEVTSSRSGGVSSSREVPEEQQLHDVPVHPQLVVLGKGQVWMEEVVGELGQHYPRQAVGVVDFNESLAHLIMAGADYLMIPSRFEPCGLVALAALRYGTLPIVSDTGGLRDIVGTEGPGYLMVCPGDEGNAYDFRKGVAGLVQVVQRALGEYGSEEFDAARVAAMGQEVSWREPGKQWEMLLREVLPEPEDLAQHQEQQ